MKSVQWAGIEAGVWKAGQKVGIEVVRVRILAVRGRWCWCQIKTRQPFTRDSRDLKPDPGAAQ